MNLTTLVTRIKKKLGIYSISLPIENLDKMIIDTITEITIPVFSIYQPHKETVYFDLRNLQRVSKTATYEEFLLPEFQGRTLLSVDDIRYDDRSLTGMGYWGGTIPMLHEGLTNQLMLSNAAMNLVNTGLPRLSWEFNPPRTLFIFNCIASHSLIFDLKFQHDASLTSIPPTAEESFFNLALLDVEENLYPLVKHYNPIETAYGTIELKIDDWAEAASQRKDLLKEWDDSYHLDLEEIAWG